MPSLLFCALTLPLPRACVTLCVTSSGREVFFLERDLTRGSIRKGLVLFSLPLIAGNLLQQCYNIVDTWVVGRFLGSVALAAVGSAFSLMTLLTSLLLGLCMGSGVVMSQLYGQGDREGLRRAMGNAFVGIALAALALAAAAFALLDSLMVWMRVPAEVVEDLRGYLQIIFWGIGFTFLYNFFATALRSVGNSAAAAVVFAVRCGDEYRAGFVVCHRPGLGGGGRRPCDGDRPGGKRGRDRRVFSPENGGPAPRHSPPEAGRAAYQAHRGGFRAHGRAAVHHELRHSDDPKPGQQLWRKRDGRLRGRRENRRRSPTRPHRTLPTGSPLLWRRMPAPAAPTGCGGAFGKRP